MDYPIRINRFLSSSNYCSRRQADFLIENKKVKINKRTAKLGDQVFKNDQVFVDNKEIKPLSTNVYLIFNKPVGIICTTNTNAKDNIIDYINYPVRIYPIGRLDVKSSGLIFLTNNGDIVNKVNKGENKIEKEYIVDIDKTIKNGFLQKLENGVFIDRFKTLPAKTKKLSDRKFLIIILEGKKRQIRRMCEKFGYNVIGLTRIRIGKIELKELKVGEYREIEEKEFFEKLGI